MKAITKLILLVALISLSACTVETTEPEPGPGAVEPVISNGVVTTNYQATLPGSNSPEDVICRDETTELSYSFDYSGDLSGWTSYLTGATTQRTVGEESFDLSDPRVERDGNRVTVTYRLGADAAPLLTEGDIETQAITVVPDPRVVGGTQLVLEVSGFSGFEPEVLSADPIPVITNCPAAVEEDAPVTLTNASYKSEFQAEVDGTESSVICNDEDTAFSYTFTYSGNLQSWSSYFRGVESETETSENQFNLNSDAVEVNGNEVTVRYTIEAGAIPTLVEPALDTQGIVVTPTEPEFTELFVVVDDNGTDRVLRSGEIPVLEACGTVREEPVAVTDSSYTTEFTTTIDNESRDIICDDRLTTGVVNFDYTGDLESFNLRAVGQRDGEIVEIATYTEEQITNTGSFRGAFQFQTGVAPRLTEGDAPISTQGIIISPDIVGETLFYVQPNQTGDYQLLDFEIPIAAVCPQ